MTLVELIALLKKYRKLLVVIPLIIAGGTFVFSRNIPPRYEASLNLYVTREIQPPSGEYYTYDGYYGQQAAERYTDTVVGLLKSKDVLKKVLGNLDISLEEDSLQKMEERITVEKAAPQLILIRASQRWDRSEGWKVEQVVSSLSQEAIARVNALNKNGDRAVSVQPLSEEPIVEEEEPFPILNAVVAGLLVFGMTFCVCLFKDYLEVVR